MWWVIGYFVVGFIVFIVEYITARKYFNLPADEAVGNPVLSIVLWPIILLAMIPPLTEMVCKKIYDFFS